MVKNSKILLIGSEGFIGSHLKTYLSKNGAMVLSADIIDKNEVSYHKVNFDNPDYVSLFNQFVPDYCINCSGAASVPFSFEQPLFDFNLNVYNVVKMLDAIKNNCPECKFINFSSAAVYGNPKQIPIVENTNKNPISPYGFHKSIVEDLLNEYTKFFKLRTCTLRLFSAYGDGLRKQIMFDLYNKFANDKKIELFGTGKETRDYIHIDDICKVVELVMSNSNFNNEVINVANGKEVALETIVMIFKKILLCNKDVVFTGNVRVGDPSRWQADISKLQAWGYVQTKSIEEGIAEYIRWIREE